PADDELPGEPVHAPPTQPDAAPPSTAAELPHTFTGTLTGADTWLPPPIEWLPEVRAPEPPERAAPCCTKAPPAQLACTRPPIALPHTFTGASTGALAWLPPRIEPLPEVI